MVFYVSTFILPFHYAGGQQKVIPKNLLMWYNKMLKSIAARKEKEWQACRLGCFAFVSVWDNIFPCVYVSILGAIHVRAVLILAGGGDVGGEVGVRRAADMMQQGFVWRVAIAIQGDLRLCLGRYD